MHVQKREIMYWERKVNLRGCESSTKENMQDFLKGRVPRFASRERFFMTAKYRLVAFAKGLYSKNEPGSHSDL